MSFSDEEKHALRMSVMEEELGRMLQPIEGYENMPLVSIDEAVKPLKRLVHDLERMVWTVKPNCAKPADGLSSDESASIMLYSMGWQPQESSLYVILNKTLRGNNRHLLQPWFSYLKLFITALSKLPSQRRFLYRGVKQDLSADYHQGDTFVWWGFSSCTSSVHVLEKPTFLGKTGTRTMFTIDCRSGKDIRQHSIYKKEDEVLLLAARQFKVVSSMNSGNDLHIIHVEEIDPVSPLLAPLPNDNAFAEATSIMPSTASYRNVELEQFIGKCQSAKIDLSGKRLNEQDMTIVVTQVIIGKQCTLLNLMNNKITQNGVSVLAQALRNNTYLEELNFSYNGLSDVDVRLLASVMNSSILKRIDLEANEISDEGAKYIAEMLETNTNLLQLSLSVNRISSRGVNEIATVLAGDKTRLEWLNLSANTDVNDESIDSVLNLIEHNQSLKKLDLRQCDFSEDGTAKLRSAAKSKRRFNLWLTNRM